GAEISVGPPFELRRAFAAGGSTTIAEPFLEVRDDLLLGDLPIAVGIHFVGRQQFRRGPLIPFKNAVSVLVVFLQVPACCLDDFVRGSPRRGRATGGSRGPAGSATFIAAEVVAPAILGPAAARRRHHAADLGD